jgi:hypothetical protein
MMNVRLNIIEPWQSGTKIAIDAVIIKGTAKLFLLRLETTIKFNSDDAQYFICQLQDKEAKAPLNNLENGIYPISMVFDKHVKNDTSALFELDTYRSNFLLGELIINGG